MTKTLSIKQPWSKLILLGTKTIEIRTWKTSYRGPLLIHSGKKIENFMVPILEKATGNNLQDLRVGGIIGEVHLVDIKEYKNKTEFKGDYYKHYNCVDWYEDGLYGWIFSDPMLYKDIIPLKGQLRLFEYES